MDEGLLRQATELAKSIVIPAGQLAKERFCKELSIEEKDAYGDAVTEVDVLAETMIMKEIKAMFPDHQVQGEESGRSGNRDSDYLWMIDPLDGTNNFVIGLPLFAISITLMYKRNPVLGVVYEPITNRLFVSSKQGGAACNGEPIRVKRKEAIHKGNVGWIQGHKVQNDARAMKLRHHVESQFKRMLRLWAPTIQWCMLANGDLDGIVLYNSEGDDLYSGILMVKEAGGVVVDFEGNAFTGMVDEPYLVACHPDHVEHFLTVVRGGL